MSKNNGLTAEQRVTKAKVALMSNPDTIHVSGLLMIGKTEITNDEKLCATAMTDGLNTWYNRKFVESLSDPELRAVILHEDLGHKGHRHPLVWGHLFARGIMAVSTDPKTGEVVAMCNLANIAADYYVNDVVKELEQKTGGFVKLPPHVLHDPKYSGLSVGQIWDKLIKQNPPQPPPPGMNLPGTGNGSGQVVNVPGLPEGQFDSHDEWKKAQGMTPAEQAAHNAAIDGALRQGAILAGKQAGNLTRDFTELLEPQVRWEDQLSDFVVSTCSGRDSSTWRRPNRRYVWQDIYRPTQISETIESVVIAIDTSGSIYGAVLNAFVSEAAGLMETVNPERVDLLYWDTQVAGHETYGAGEFQQMLSSTKPKGGGGTSPRCVKEYMKKKNIKPQCVIFLSDGYVDSFPQMDCPTLWVLVDNKGCTATSGQTIHIDSSGYRD